MKKFILVALFLFLSGGAAFACHKGDMTQLRDHKAKLPFGFLLSSEQGTASTSTTTSCNWYTNILDHQYDKVAENAAQGSGALINIIADSHGCLPAVYPLFGREIKENHAQIFDAASEKDSHVLIERFQRLINRIPILSIACGRSAS